MNEITSEIIPKILPIFLLIILGIVVRRKSLLSDSSVEDLKKIIINLILPCVLYFSFVTLDLRLDFFILVAGMFITCVLLFLLGHALKSPKLIRSEHSPFLFTGFEFGMMGASLFGAVFGIEKVGYIGLVGLGHEIFIWFVFVTFLIMKRDGSSNLLETAKGFVKSPVIIAIVLGIGFNVTGIAQTIETFSLIQALYAAMHFIENMIVPLILIVIGYGLDLKQIRIKSGLIVVGVRFGILIPFALVINRWFVRGFLGLDVMYGAAIFTFFILPPPFIIPLFIKKDDLQSQSEINGVLVVYSVFSLLAFSAYYAYFAHVHGI